MTLPKSFYVSCSCYSSNHFLRFLTDPDLAGVLYVDFSSDPLRFRDRIKEVWQALKGKPVCYGEIILQQEQIADMISYLLDAVREKPKTND